jgi:homoserine O-acetyltransferase/O-succinyltransferase
MTMFREIAFATAAVAAGSVAQAADAGSGVSTGAQSDPSSATTPHQADATFATTGSAMARRCRSCACTTRRSGGRTGTRKGHQPCRLAADWTGASGEALLTPEYRTTLFAPGAPFDASRYFVILPDAVGRGRSSKPSDGLKATSPRYGYMVDLQHMLVTETLGATQLRGQRSAS